MKIKTPQIYDLRGFVFYLEIKQSAKL